MDVSRSSTVLIQGQNYLEWAAPNRFAAGWQQGSAPLGVVGNTVLNGHNNIHGDVFARLGGRPPGRYDHDLIGGNGFLPTGLPTA